MLFLLWRRIIPYSLGGLANSLYLLPLYHRLPYHQVLVILDFVPCTPRRSACIYYHLGSFLSSTFLTFYRLFFIPVKTGIPIQQISVMMVNPVVFTGVNAAMIAAPTPARITVIHKTFRCTQQQTQKAEHSHRQRHGCHCLKSFCYPQQIQASAIFINWNT